MQNNMQIWLESSTTTFNLNSHDEGVYLVSDLDGLTSLPSIRTSQGVNAGTDGGWTSAQAFDARLIDVNIVIANEDVSIVESKRRTLNSLLAQSRKETLKLHFISEAGMEYVINVRVMNVTGALTNILKKQELLIQLRADDPIIYGAQTGEGADATLTVQQASGGFEIPFDIPLIISGGTDKTNVENLGSEDVYPVIKMTGPLHNPTVVNETQNAEIGVNADLGDMEWRGYEDFSLYGNTTQETLSGKNLLNSTPFYTGPNYYNLSAGTQFSAGSSATVNVSWNDNKASIACTTTWRGALFLAEVEEGKTYHNYSHQTGDGARTTLYTLDSTYTIVRNVGNAASDDFTRDANITIGAGEKYLALAVGCGNPASTITLENPQIELNTSYSGWEPYCGGIPAPNPDFPMPVENVSGRQEVRIIPEQKNLADPQTFIDWTRKTYGLCVEYPWGNDTSRPAYGEFQGRSHVVRYNADTLYTVRSQMIYPTYEEAQEVFTKLGTGEPFKAGTQYTISTDAYCSGGTYGNMNMRVIYTDETYSILPTTLTPNTWRHITLTTVSGKTVKSIAIYYQSGTTYIDLDTLQIEEGATASEYTPFVSSKYAINFGGGNIIDLDGKGGTSNQIETVITNNTAHFSGTSSSSWANITTTITGISLPVGDYSFSIDHGIPCRLKFNAKQADNTYQAYIIPAGATSVAFKTTQEIIGFYIFIDGFSVGDSFDETINIMFNKGLTALPYAPYTTYAYELCKIGTYQDYIYKDGEKWYKHAEIKKIILDGRGSEGWQKLNVSFQRLSAETDKLGSGIALCDHFTFNPVQSSITANLSNGEFGFNTSKYLTCRYDTANNVDDFKDWLKANNTSVYYILDTPTDTEITDSELVGQLNALLDYAPWYGEDQNVFLIPSAGAQGTFTIGAHNPPKPADEVLIDTQLKTVTLNGQNIYHLLKDGSSFFTLAPGDNTMYLTSDVASDTGKAEIKFKQGFISI